MLTALIVAVVMLYLFGMLATVNSVHANGKPVFERGFVMVGIVMMVLWPMTAVIGWHTLRERRWWK